jgi:hypothetical protein
MVRNRLPDHVAQCQLRVGSQQRRKADIEFTRFSAERESRGGIKRNRATRWRLQQIFAETVHPGLGILPGDAGHGRDKRQARTIQQIIVCDISRKQISGGAKLVNGAMAGIIDEIHALVPTG